ncbi:MAG: hypothetical protein RLZZ481_1685 [Pseudomonadota bacterium]|jgi:hypothetical protein
MSKITDVGAALDPQFVKVDTPRTDALMSDISAGWHLRWADSHVQLECELAEAVAAERERCAKVCEEMANSRYLLDDERQVAHSCAEAIRKGE